MWDTAASSVLVKEKILLSKNEMCFLICSSFCVIKFRYKKDKSKDLSFVFINLLYQTQFFSDYFAVDLNIASRTVVARLDCAV